MSTVAVIETSQLTKVYDGETVVHATDFSATEGSIHAIAGPNGAGKSTLLKMMAGLIKPTEGSLRLFGAPITDEILLRQRVHYISSEVNMYPTFQVKEVLKYASLLYKRWDAGRAKFLVETFSLPPNRTLRLLSPGMKARLRIVLALSAQPDVLLLDEATNGMDPVTKDQFLDLLLQESANRGLTAIMATHQLTEIERAADTLSVLAGGRLICTSNLDELKERIQEVIASIPGGDDQMLVQLPGLVDYKTDGEVYSLVVTGVRTEIERYLTDMGASFVNIRSASLERWLQSVLKKEGVQSDAISLPQGTVV
ncbi:MAG: ABC transporter ATP-binding protein [Bacilli bacterium]